jgi:GT2 family glycosyltransferase
VSEGVSSPPEKPALEPREHPEARSDAAPDLSVVIVNRNTAGLLRACLGSLRREADDLRLEIVVVDNGSTDGSVEMVEECFPEVRLLANARNEGFALPNNQGMALATGRHVMLLNSDTEVRAGALRALVSVLESEPGIGAVGPALLFPDGRRQRSASSFKTPWRHFCDMVGLGRLFPRSAIFANQNARLDFGRPHDVDWLIAAAIVVRGSVVKEVGGLDERFRIHCNDDDWCRRIRDAGHGIRYHPAAEVVHHSGSTLQVESVTTNLDDELVRNLFEYHRKYFGTAGVLWLRIWMVVGYGTRALMALAGRAVREGDPRGRRAARFGKLALAGILGPARAWR